MTDDNIRRAVGRRSSSKALQAAVAAALLLLLLQALPLFLYQMMFNGK
jgi:hypothetical protein